MSRIFDIQEQMTGTAAALAELERAIVQRPGSYGLTVNRRSLQKRQRELEAEFAEVARVTAVDVCRYRMFSEDDEPTALAATTAVADFQVLLSLVHDAIKNGPRRQNKPSSESVNETAFRLGYIFQGSVGFTLMLPSKQPLLPESDIDHSIATVFRLMTATSQEQLTDACRSLGPAVIRSVYKWLNDHLDHLMGADIQWVRGQEVRSNVFIQQRQLRALREIVELTSESIADPVEVTGIYVGIDVRDEIIHIEMKDEPDIRAKFGQGFKAPQLPPPIGCVAKLIKETKIHLATEKEDVKYTILKMRVGAV